jgi:SPP1 gp7 family putative phage head morphogenesis protein
VRLSADEDLIAKLAKEWAEEVEKIWERKSMLPSNDKITKHYGSYLSQALEEGYGEPVVDIDYDTPDGNMLQHLVDNVYHFSAAKNKTQLRQLTRALIGDDGKLRTWSQFKQAAFQINDTHVNQWLKAEYELAVSGSQMASKWVDIQNNGTTMLEFDAVMDGKTSAGCRELNGVRRAVDDRFWDIYYPPNHFNCRSTVRQLNGGKETPEHQIIYPDEKAVPQMFRTNLAKEKLVFPKNHPYYQ